MNPHNSNQTFPSAPPGFSLPNPNLNLNLNLSPNLEQPNTSTTTTTPRMAMIPLVRMMDLELPEKRQWRNIIRRTRMVFDSVRVLVMAEEEEEEEEEEGNFNVRRVRSDLKASATMRSRGLWLNCDKRIVGAIPGICIGDVFLYRMELCVVGLHGEPQAGIDYFPGSMSSIGDPIATSVIVSGGYDEGDVDEGDVIILSGHGRQDKNPRQVFHQKIEGGDLAMERSMHYGIEVRVIRAVRYQGTSSTSGKVYVYDGLYRIVECCRFDVGKNGFGVFKFMLSRIDGQAKMGSLVLKEAFLRKQDPSCYKPMCVISHDISNKMERVGIRLFNDIDECKDPMYFEYLPRATFFAFEFHPKGNETGCKCVGSCGEGCICFMKNGNSFPYSQSGFLLKGKPVIFECGPSCSCLPHCRNRVTQQGLNHRLEVFRSLETGWGVRSFDLIQAGTFICEYSGVVLTREQAEIMTMGGDSLIYPNRFPKRWTEWGNLSLIQDGYAPPSYPSILPLNFALDVSRMRNVACYISHSSTPNLMVQFVVYDCNNQFYLKTMLFAMENIPPLREFSLDYGVVDDELIRKPAMHN
ncbi:putative histone-lysine N-methyltransferase chromatin remodeling SET family [Medicago truncatula]|uniref:Histone-lysine N-methyltransferase, suvh protein n=1 Tax=Medicago truncatula TaxID=3880 RepID=A0A072VG77_MEDTR|nr:histone-lysine N-methyltransferase family member SUVH9 [Medicago truncatula]KEH40792.1 histone-lysine N-methyltransferase, suvh protein [Medicago truncatula]RHN78209.1 putative histone-lysine N-methyltransferase chromatin remodeling SET family [Medicago truncatula]